jgi:hypothetical protein
MTKNEFLKRELLRAVEEGLKDSKFTLSKSQAEFIRRSNEGWDKYQLMFLNRNEGWEINPAMLIRKNIVEDIFHCTSGFEKKYQKGTPTIGSSIENYLGERNGNYRFELAEESQIGVIAQKIIALFKEVALPFFSKYNTIESLDLVINENIADVELTGAIFKGSKGIILAKLTDRNNYKYLVEIYTKYYENFSDGFYLLRFKNLLEALAVGRP